MGNNNNLVRIVVALIVAFGAGGINFWYLASKKPKTAEFLYFASEVERGSSLSTGSGGNVGVFAAAFENDEQLKTFSEIFIPRAKLNVVNGLVVKQNHRANTPLINDDFHSNSAPPNYEVLGPFRCVEGQAEGGETLAVEVEYYKNRSEGEPKFDEKTGRLIQILTNKNNGGDLKIFAVVSYADDVAPADGAALDGPAPAAIAGKSKDSLVVYVPTANVRGVSQVVADGGSRKIGFLIPASAAPLKD